MFPVIPAGRIGIWSFSKGRQRSARSDVWQVNPGTGLEMA